MNSGFTLIELLVVIAIMAVVMAVVFTSQSSFNKTLVLTNTAYDIALSIQSAETYGISGRAVGTTFNVGYGLHFDKNNPKDIIFFADTNPTLASSGPFCHSVKGTPSDRPGDCAYQASEKIKDYKLGNNMSISNFCAKQSNGWVCSKSSNLASLDIVFSRPNPNPFMSINGIYSQSFPVTAACLTISSPQGDSRFVSIAYAGMISASATSCP